MTDTLLRALRERALDESEPLAGLLRKCLLLGAETGSSSLRDWARLELNGYAQDDALPEYRELSGAPLTMDSTSGNTWIRGQTVNRLQLPPSAREYVRESLTFWQPVEEFERLATEKSLHFKPAGLAVAQGLWNRELGPFQSIVNLSYVVPGSAFAGILGQIRTKLVDLIADLTIATPLTDLPRREDVDAAVRHRIGHVGDIYTTTVVKPSGPTAIGSGASASSGLEIGEVLRLITAVQVAATSDAADTSEIDKVTADLREALLKEQTDTGEILKSAGRLRTLSDKLGVAAVSSATSAAVAALTEMAMQGAFG